MERKAQIVEGIKYKPILKCDLDEALVDKFYINSLNTGQK
ncbi:hypothetical protein BH10ACI1_BH10ACI1_35440 [soil metagenome]